MLVRRGEIGMLPGPLGTLLDNTRLRQRPSASISLGRGLKLGRRYEPLELPDREFLRGKVKRSRDLHAVRLEFLADDVFLPTFRQSLDHPTFFVLGTPHQEF